MKDKLWLKQMMDDREITIEEMADCIGVKERTMFEYYHGWRDIGRDTLRQICKVLDLDNEEVARWQSN